MSPRPGSAKKLKLGDDESTASLQQIVDPDPEIEYPAEPQRDPSMALSEAEPEASQPSDPPAAELPSGAELPEPEPPSVPGPEHVPEPAMGPTISSLHRLLQSEVLILLVQAREAAGQIVARRTENPLLDPIELPEFAVLCDVLELVNDFRRLEVRLLQESRARAFSGSLRFHE